MPELTQREAANRVGTTVKVIRYLASNDLVPSRSHRGHYYFDASSLPSRGRVTEIVESRFRWQLSKLLEVTRAMQNEVEGAAFDVEEAIDTNSGDPLEDAVWRGENSTWSSNEQAMMTEWLHTNLLWDIVRE